MPRDLRIWLGGGFIVFLILVALFAPLLAPFDPLEQDLMVFGKWILK
jgi:peptide/nickel transport system permease protein